MKICVYGAGAIGGFLAARLAAAGAEVTIIARGPHLEAIRSRGLTLRFEGREEVLPIPARDDPAEAGPQDYVILTLKVPAPTSSGKRSASRTEATSSAVEMVPALRTSRMW